METKTSDFHTDFGRWELNARQKPSWDGRNQLIASWIPPGSSVIDVGAGAMTLEQYLAPGTDYTPLDVVTRSDRTLRVNFNTYEIPQLTRIHDYAVCSGVLEYIIPVHLFLDTVSKWARHIILSYAISDMNPDATTSRTGWHNKFSDLDIKSLFHQHGLFIERTTIWEKQKIYMLDSSKAANSIFSLPQSIVSRPDIASVYRYDPTNVGDAYCAPLLYFDFGSLRCLDILDLQNRKPEIPSNIIAGGGGLLGNPTFNRCFENLFAQKPQNVVGWGLGENSRIDVSNGYVERGKLSYPQFIDRFSLLGVRDYGTDYLWVPCASCMHPLFSEKWDIQNEIVVFEHKRVPISIDCFPKMNNDTKDFSSVIRFLATAQVVITNSYHAVYWSQLLGKAVLAFPFSTKFYYFKHKVTLCKPSEWKKYLENVEEQPPALHECIEANYVFFEKVGEMLNLNKPDYAPLIPQRAVRVQISDSCNEIKIDIPPDENGVKTLINALQPSDIVTISDSENSRYDPLKFQLFEHQHIGRNAQTGKQTWRGATVQQPSCPARPEGCSLPTVINFFTINTGYEDAAKRLRVSCEETGVPHVIVGIPSLGSWERNCAYKSEFIFQKWRELKQPVLWVDADAVVRRPPSLLAGTDADFAIHKVNRWQFASGTLYFNQTENARRLLECWIRLCKETPSVWDQVHLDSAWEETTCLYPLKTLWLPQSYTKIFDRDVLPGEDPQPVIEHFQASRELKKKVSDLPPSPSPRFPPNFIATRSVSRMTRQSIAEHSKVQWTEDILDSLRGKRIAIVGNATSSHEFGSVIDSYDIVIRINNFRIAGYEKHVGVKTDYRCTSGWKDIEHKKDLIEFSPFTLDAPESANLESFVSRNQQPVSTARTDIHPLAPAILKPSTGCALVTLCSHLCLPVDLFFFDGFKSSHYWEENASFFTTHSQDEFNLILKLPNVRVMNQKFTEEEVLSSRESSFHIKDGYLCRLKPEYFNDSVTESSGHTWQPDVYAIAAILARRLECNRFIDIGCGRGIKLSQLHPEFLITGIDFGNNISYCRRNYNFGQWIEKDLELPLSFELPKQLLSKSIIVCSDVIEHLANPKPLLHSLRALLDFCPVLIISTPERDLVRGINHFGPPTNKAHVREWNIQEFHELLKEFGFSINFIGLTRSDTIKNKALTILAVLTSKPRSGLLEGGKTGEAVVLQAEVIQFLSSPCSRLSNKESHELSYWEERKDKEGTLANSHYEYFFTAHFKLTRDFFTGKRILDVGCGPRGSLEWADMVKERIGCDPLANQYAILGADKHKMRYVAAPSESIPFANDYFDIVSSFNSLDHVENLYQSIAEIIRVIKPGGIFLLLTDVNHTPTPCEPIEFSWDVVKIFQPKLELVEQTHFEKPEGWGLYQSVKEAIAYDHTKIQKRHGILSAKFLKPVASDYSETKEFPAEAGDSLASNEAAFEHLQKGFNLLKERCFAEARHAIQIYNETVDYQKFKRTDNRKEQNPKVSVVIVAYKIGQDLIQCLNSITASENPPYEIIVVDNGGNEDIAVELAKRSILHVQVGFNVILAEGRNIGVYFAKAPVISFIDDDAIAAPGYLASALEAFETYDIHGFRGKVLPKTDDENNQMANHYDLGFQSIPSDIDTEGNSAFLAQSWRQLGGQDPLLFGGEGLDLSYRAYKAYGNYKTIYWPWSVIYHDYAALPGKLEAKHERHSLMRAYSEFKHPELYSYHNQIAAFAKSESARRTGNELIPKPVGNASHVYQTIVSDSGPLISICIPTFNRGEFLETAAQSALEQSYPNYEIVIVDDGSTDETSGIARKFSSEKVRYVRKEHSGGPATRNRCITEARSDFIVWLDSDDLLFPQTLQYYADALKSEPAMDVLYGDLLVFSTDSNSDNVWNYQDYSTCPEALLPGMFLRNSLPNVCTLVRKSCYEKVGAYSVQFPRAHDYEFWSRLARVGRFRHVQRVVGKYRQHEKSLSNTGGRAKTVYESNVVKKMLEENPLPTLFPYCYRNQFPRSRSEAHALRLAACVLLKWADHTAALDLIKRSQLCCPLEAGERLYWLLEKLHFKTSNDGLAMRRSDIQHFEFTRFIDKFIQARKLGNLAAGAEACGKMMELEPGALETLVIMGYCLSDSDNSDGARTAFEILIKNQLQVVFADLFSSEADDIGQLSVEWINKWKL